MRRWIGRALLVAGAAGVAAGLANVLVPSAAFPSSVTCVSDWDLVLCNIEPWAAAPWLALLGAVTIAAAAVVLRDLSPVAPPGGDATR
jgi:hypothetical protein